MPIHRSFCNAAILAAGAAYSQNIKNVDTTLQSLGQSVPELRLRQSSRDDSSRTVCRQTIRDAHHRVFPDTVANLST